MRRLILSILLLFPFATQTSAESQTEILFLSGTDSDHPETWDFLVTGGRKAGDWTSIPVPSCWELQGFGAFNYGHDKDKSREQGKYRHSFSVPETWIGREIMLVFEGVMTDAAVKVNGKSPGPEHQGGFYRFEYNITGLIKAGEENLLEVLVSKVSSNESINAAERTGDYWVFGGIYRPVYLRSVPREHIAHTAIDAGADGSFTMNLHLENISDADRVSARIVNQEGLPVSGKFSAPLEPGTTRASLNTRVEGQRNWTAENPELYYVDVCLRNGDKEIHNVRERFGFRTIEVRRGEGIFLNGSRIVLKGVDRHSFRPDKGRALSRNDCLEDIQAIKAMNMNAVRMSHYPPDTWFLDLCDEHGLYVLDELAGWQKPPYDTPTGERLVKAMVERDVNHPSILFWDNGNEGGWNRDLDDDFALYDPQKRQVLHPYELHEGIDTDHYEDYQSTLAKLEAGNIFMPTEYLHGLYDGGLGAGLDDYWSAMWGHPLTGGMFLWVFADEGLVRGDLNGYIDTDGNHAPDGILGPHGEKEASFYTIREIWSPVYIETSRSRQEAFDGSIEIENRYDFTNLSECSFRWKLVRFPQPGSRQSGYGVLEQGRLKGPDIPAGEKGILHLPSHTGTASADALVLSAFGGDNRLICEWSWPLQGTSAINKRFVNKSGTRPSLQVFPDRIEVTSGITTFHFDPKSGLLSSLEIGSHAVPFGSGPILQPKNETAGIPESGVTIEEHSSSIVLQAHGNPQFENLEWTLYGSGWVKLDYEYEHKGAVDFLGISFSYPEERLHGMTWLGKGPYRVWQNRLKGGTLNLWEKPYRNFRVNTSWDYPVFPGYYSDFHWVTFQTSDGPLTIAAETDGLYFRAYSQEDGEDPRHTAMKWPEGDISVLHAIPAIGTKFLEASRMGPQGEQFKAEGSYGATLWFYFGRPPAMD